MSLALLARTSVIPSMMICLPPQGTTPTNTASDTAHSAHNTQPALRPHRATPRVEDAHPLHLRVYGSVLLNHGSLPRRRGSSSSRTSYGVYWPLHDMVIANIVWYILQSRGVGEILYCAIVWGMTGGLGAYTQGGCAKNSIDSCTQAQKQNNVLYRPRCVVETRQPCHLPSSRVYTAAGSTCVVVLHIVDSQATVGMRVVFAQLRLPLFCCAASAWG